MTAKYRLTKPAYLCPAGSAAPVVMKAGDVVDLDGPPPITAEPLNQEAIDAFRAQHGNMRMRPNGLQVYDASTGRTKVALAGGGWSK